MTSLKTVSYANVVSIYIYTYIYIYVYTHVVTGSKHTLCNVGITSNKDGQSALHAMCTVGEGTSMRVNTYQLMALRRHSLAKLAILNEASSHHS